MKYMFNQKIYMAGSKAKHGKEKQHDYLKKDT